MNLKDIFINSVKFLVHEWKIFCIVLLYHSLIFAVAKGFPTSVPINPEPISLIVDKAPYLLLNLLFWISIVPVIILRAERYFGNQHIKRFKIADISTNAPDLTIYRTVFILLGLLISIFITLDYSPSVYMGTITITEIFQFLLFLTPAIIVLENKRFIEGSTRAITRIRANFKESIIFYLLLALILSLFHFPENMQLLGVSISPIPGLEYFQLILNTGSFIFYNTAVVGFYLSVSRNQPENKR